MQDCKFLKVHKKLFIQLILTVNSIHKKQSSEIQSFYAITVYIVSVKQIIQYKEQRESIIY